MKSNNWLNQNQRTGSKPNINKNNLRWFLHQSKTKTINYKIYYTIKNIFKILTLMLINYWKNFTIYYLYLKIYKYLIKYIYIIFKKYEASVQHCCFDSKIYRSRNIFLHIKFHTFFYGKNSDLLYFKFCWSL